MDKDFASNDWKDYGIQAHSLKSTSATIGAAGLSEMAAKAETAAKQPDLPALEELHAPLLDLCSRTVSALRAFLPGTDPFSPDGDEIMEFSPEDSE